MGRVRVLLVALVVVVASLAVVSGASATEWPVKRQFLLLETPQDGLGAPPSSVAEGGDGTLYVLMYSPVIRKTKDGGFESTPRTRLARIGLDGTRVWLSPFDRIIHLDEEILPLPDGTILFSRERVIDRWRPDGSIVRFAGRGRYSEDASGDGGPATSADLLLSPVGLSRFADGSVVFGNGARIRRVGPDGIITTIAGTGEPGFRGDGGPATAAQLAGPSDVLPTEEGGFLIADTFNGRVREVAPNGVISTLAGTRKEDIFDSFGDGGPATAAGLALPRHLGRLPDGSVVIGEWQRIRRVSRDGTISTIFQVPEIRGDRLGDFAGRYAHTVEGMEVTAEGGIAVILSGLSLRAVYLAPRQTQRTLLALRDARTSRRRVAVTIDTTTPGRLELEVRRGGKLIAHTTRRVESGRHVIGVGGRFPAAYHQVRATIRTDRGGHSDRARLFTSSTLPKRLVIPRLRKGPPVRACKRIDRRRIDCQIRSDESWCLSTSAYRLFPSGLLYRRWYGGCQRKPVPFDRTPNWSGPWHRW